MDGSANASQHDFHFDLPSVIPRRATSDKTFVTMQGNVLLKSTVLLFNLEYAFRLVISLDASVDQTCTVLFVSKWKDAINLIHLIIDVGQEYLLMGLSKNALTFNGEIIRLFKFDLTFSTIYHLPRLNVPISEPKLISKAIPQKYRVAAEVSLDTYRGTITGISSCSDTGKPSYYEMDSINRLYFPFVTLSINSVVELSNVHIIKIKGLINAYNLVSCGISSISILEAGRGSTVTLYYEYDFRDLELARALKGYPDKLKRFCINNRANSIFHSECSLGKYRKERVDYVTLSASGKVHLKEQIVVLKDEWFIREGVCIYTVDRKGCVDWIEMVDDSPSSVKCKDGFVEMKVHVEHKQSGGIITIKTARGKTIYMLIPMALIECFHIGWSYLLSFPVAALRSSGGIESLVWDPLRFSILHYDRADRDMHGYLRVSEILEEWDDQKLYNIKGIVSKLYELDGIQLEGFEPFEEKMVLHCWVYIKDALIEVTSGRIGIRILPSSWIVISDNLIQGKPEELELSKLDLNNSLKIETKWKTGFVSRIYRNDPLELLFSGDGEDFTCNIENESDKVLVIENRAKLMRFYMPANPSSYYNSRTVNGHCIAKKSAKWIVAGVQLVDTVSEAFQILNHL